MSFGKTLISKCNFLVILLLIKRVVTGKNFKRITITFQEHFQLLRQFTQNFLHFMYLKNQILKCAHVKELKSTTTK